MDLKQCSVTSGAEMILAAGGRGVLGKPGS